MFVHKNEMTFDRTVFKLQFPYILILSLSDLRFYRFNINLKFVCWQQTADHALHVTISDKNVQ